MIFYNNNGILDPRRKQYFDLEKDIQKLTEDNLETVFGLEFVKTEFVVKDFRIDTLAFDKKSKSFIIIEYKRNKNFAASDQCYTYLKAMMDNKAEFVMVYNEIKDCNFKRYDINWESSKVIFISTEFTKYQQNAVLYEKGIPVELYEVKKYSNNLVSFDKVKSNKSIAIPSPKVDDKTIVKNGRDMTQYDENHHLDNTSEQMKALYKKIKSMILDIDDSIGVIFNKTAIRFFNSKSQETIKKNINIVDICMTRQGNMFAYINIDCNSIIDPKNMIRDVSDIGHWGYGNCEVRFSNDNDLEYIVGLIKQSYEVHDN